MSRRPQNFRQADLTKALKAMLRAGIPVGRVKIDKSGAIDIVPAAEEERQTENEWDAVK